MKKIMYITPHLSTGGAPQYLLKKIQLLNELFDLYVIEYNDYGIYRVQKDKIIEIIGNKLHTLPDNKFRILNHIREIEPDIIHFEEMPEFFMNDDVSKSIYTTDRPYKIYETSHDSSFSPKHKRFFPDKFLFCSDNQLKIFKDLGIPSSVIEYPIEIKNKVNRDEKLRELGLDPNIKHVLNVGLFSSRKNQGEIFEYARMMGDIPIQFHFVGNMAPNFEDYWKPIVENKPDNCILWGERSDVDNFYSCMDLFLFTSKGHQGDKETNPLAIKEALSWNMPVLTYRLDSYMDKLDDKVVFLTNDYEKNVLKVMRILGLSDHVIESFITNDNDEIKVFLNTNTKFDILRDKYYGIYDSKNDLLIFRSKVFGPSLFTHLNAKERFLNGIKIKIYDVDHDYFSSLNDDNMINEFNLLYEKEFDFGNQITVQVDGEIRDIHGISDDPSSWFTFYEIFLQNIYSKLNIKNGDTVIDLGGHYGFFDLYAVKNGAKKVYTFEPSKKTYDVLCKNLTGIDKVEKYNMAVSDTINGKEFLSLGSSSINSFYDSFNTSPENSTTLGIKKKEHIPTIDLNTFLHNNDIDRVDIMKMDCEGSEWDIMPTLTDNFLKYRLRKIIMEVHDFHVDNSVEARVKRAKELIDRLEKCNYKLEYDTEILAGELGYLYGERKPKIKIVHMLVNPDGEREIESIKHLKKLSEYSGFEYYQEINDAYIDIPPKETCARPNDVQAEPGHYKLTGPHYGNYMAHRMSFEKHLTDECDAVLFCECDAIFIKPMEEIYRQIVDRYDDLCEHDLKYVSFGKRIENYHHHEINQYGGITDRMSEAHFYMVPSKHRDYFIHKFQYTGWDTYDLWLNNNILNEKVGMITSQPFSIQCSGVSYLDKSYKDGTTLLKEGDITYEY